MSPQSTRRDFLATSSAAAVGLAALTFPKNSAHAAGEESPLKVGLIGCGGRGTDAARQAMRADKNVKLWAMADAFSDRLELSRNSLGKIEDLAAKIDVPPERRFVGFNAYQDVIACCDVVLLTTPPQFRPLHLQAAVDAGKHVFAEKPCAVDAPGVRKVLQICKEAEQKKLSIVSGLCLRYDYGFQEIVKRIHEGEIGKVHTLQANDYRGGIWVKPRLPEWTDMTWQMRNWYYFTWLSGDFNVEQHVHFLDVCAWIMQNQYPVRAVGLGGRQVRTEPEYGHIYDHFSIVYEYADGTKFFSNCRQQQGCVSDMSAHVAGNKGLAHISERKKGLVLKKETGDWAFTGDNGDLYQTEHNELFASIRNGKPINNGPYMANSTLLAIMGRMAAYTGQAITWEMAMSSQDDLTPPKYDWDVPLPVPPVAKPGVTKFV